MLGCHESREFEARPPAPNLADYEIHSGIIELLRNNPKVRHKAKQIVVTGDDICIDAIGYYEAKRKALRKNLSAQLNELSELRKNYDIMLHDNRSIFETAARNWARFDRDGVKKDKLRRLNADILIASNAIQKGHTLVTSDKGFQMFLQYGLKTEDWRK